MATKILLAEDDPNFGSVLRDFLKIHGYDVSWATDGAKGFSMAQVNRYDICIFDVMMPEMDGFTLARETNKLHPNTPFIFLTSKGLKEDMIEGFKIGAADYITKPFDAEVLLYRIQAALRKAPEAAKVSSNIYIGCYTFNPTIRTLSCNGNEEKLSPKEAALLDLLFQYKNQVLPRDLALQHIWNNNDYFSARSMDVYITKLRKHLKEEPSVKIENIHGSGFRFMVE